MRTIVCLATLAACLLPACADYTDGLCIPHVDTFCHQSKTYWLDSCDRVENVLEECQCGCRAEQYGCRTCGEKECEEDADCPTGFFCDRSDWLCKYRECIPECDERCCGGDGCGGTCPDTCRRGETCNPDTCRCESTAECRTNSDCPPGYWCDRTVWRCRPEECIPNCTGKCCGDDGCGGACPDYCPAGYACDIMTCACVGGGQLCPPGQECVDITGNGFMGCLIPPAGIPPDNPTDCAATFNCDGNFFCHCTTDNCSESACIENCGSCPAGLVCFELWDNGLRACLTPDWQVPPDAPYCDGSIPCQGNAVCYTDTVNNFCLYNCSSD